jgi:hypothetical protein
MPQENNNGVWSLSEDPTIQQMDATYSHHIFELFPLPPLEPMFKAMQQNKKDSGYETEDTDLENWDWDVVKTTESPGEEKENAKESANEVAGEKSRTVLVERVNEEEGNDYVSRKSCSRPKMIIMFKGLRQVLEEWEMNNEAKKKGEEELPKPTVGLWSMPRTSETKRGSRARGASVVPARAIFAHMDISREEKLAKTKAGKKRSVVENAEIDKEVRDAMLLPHPPKKPKTKSQPQTKLVIRAKSPPKPTSKPQASKRPGAREGTRSNPNGNAIQNTTPYTANATQVDAIHRLPAPYRVPNPALLCISRTSGEGSKAAWRRLFPDLGEAVDYHQATGVHWSKKMCFKSDVRGVDGVMGGWFERNPGEGGLMGELGMVGTRLRMEREARESQEEGGRSEVESMGRGPIGDVGAAVTLVMMRR